MLEEKLQAIIDFIQSLIEKSGDPEVDQEEIAAQIETAKAEAETISKTIKRNAELKKELDKMREENTPKSEGINVNAKPINKTLNDTFVSVGDNDAENLFVELDVTKAFLGEKGFSFAKMTERGRNQMIDKFETEKQMKLSPWLVDLAIGKTDNNVSINKSKAIQEVNDKLRSVVERSRSFSKASPVLSVDVTGYSTDSGLGDTIVSAFEPNVLSQPMDYSDLVSRCKRVPVMQNGKLLIPALDYAAGRFAGVRSYRTGEGVASTDTNAYFKGINISAQPCTSMTDVSQYAISRSGFDLTGMIVDLLTKSLKYRMSQEILVGTGTTMCDGVIGYSGVNEVPRQVVNEIHVKDLTNLAYAVSWALRTAGGEYWISDDAEKYLSSLQALQGTGVGTAYGFATTEAPLFRQTVADSFVTKLLGYNFLVHDYTNLAENAAAAPLGSAGDAIFINPNFYAFGIEKDITISRSEDFKFDKGLVTFKIDSSFTGAPLVPGAISILKATIS
jgi:HK97 family phage major capsid protein